MPRITTNPAAVPVGTILRQARRNQGLTIDQVCESIGCSPSNLSALERGHYHPRVALLVKLAEYLGVEPWRILRAACKLRDRQRQAARRKVAA